MTHEDKATAEYTDHLATAKRFYRTRKKIEAYAFYLCLDDTETNLQIAEENDDVVMAKYYASMLEIFKSRQNEWRNKKENN